jgi:hypothetical protein
VRAREARLHATPWATKHLLSRPTRPSRLMQGAAAGAESGGCVQTVRVDESLLARAVASSQLSRQWLPALPVDLSCVGEGAAEYPAWMGEIARGHDEHRVRREWRRSGVLERAGRSGPARSEARARVVSCRATACRRTGNCAVGAELVCVSRQHRGSLLRRPSSPPMAWPAGPMIRVGSQCCSAGFASSASRLLAYAPMSRVAQ